MAAQTPSPHSTLFCALAFDEFAAQVAAAYDPGLRGTSYVVVRQRSESHKSVVWSVSPAAKAQGVYAGMPVYVLKKERAGVGIVAYDPVVHAAVHEELRNLLVRFSPVVEIGRNCACLLDLSRTPMSRAGDRERAAITLQNSVPVHTGLCRPAVGMAASRLVAVLMARKALPDGINSGPYVDEENMLSGLETRVLPGISPIGRERLKKYGLRFIGQIQRLDRQALVTRFGAEGERLYCMVHGIDIRATVAPSEPLHIETVLDHDINDNALLAQYLHRTIDRFCHAVCAQGLVVHTLLLVIQYTDRKTARRTVSFHGGTGDYKIMAQRVAVVFDELYTRRVGIRSIALTERRLEQENGQMDLFTSEHDDKQKRFGSSIVKVRQKNHFDAVFCGGDYGAYRTGVS